MQGRNPKVNARPEANVRSKLNVVNAGPEPDAGLEPDAGPKPNAVNAGSIGNRVGVDNLVISLGDPWSAQCAKTQGDCFVYLSFYSPFATVTRLGAVPLNLQGMNSPFTTTARLGIFSRASLLP
ncbi:hypothetical protein CRG98_003777 [Punica granatum]|uniref:Uncharacterized protein n=1 Tax=Punica granatum TaxID=22663 RepID=A0A2I0L595_PUNGR|nr:hypothetical protein CRG98_003777 [Punica granatum]